MIWMLLACSAEQSVDIGGRSLDVRCEGSGPGILIEMGNGDVQRSWRKLQGELAGLGEVCVYDRAGVRGSDPGPMPRSSSAVAEDAEALVLELGLQEPLTLMGHSAGGLHVETEARLLSLELAALVFLDPRLGQFERDKWEHFTSEEAEAERDFLDRAAEGDEGFDAEVAAAEQSAEELLDLGELPELPVLVLSADDLDPDKAADQLWIQSHEDLAASVSEGQQRALDGSGHNMHLWRPGQVMEQIEAFLDSAAEG